MGARNEGVYFLCGPASGSYKKYTDGYISYRVRRCPTRHKTVSSYLPLDISYGVALRTPSAAEFPPCPLRTASADRAHGRPRGPTIPGTRVLPDKALWGAGNEYITSAHGYPLPDPRLARRKLSKGVPHETLCRLGVAGTPRPAAAGR